MIVAALQAGEAGASYDLRKIFDGTVVQARPIDAVTLVDNHDTQGTIAPLHSLPLPI